MHTQARHSDEKAPQTELNAHHPAAQSVLETADRFEEQTSPPNRTQTTIAMILRREAHHCTARYLAMMQEGLPPDAAEMLAQDDMAFQLVKSLAESLD